MTKRIIYQTDSGGVALIIPAMDCGLSVEEIARKDVPINTRYAIVDADTLPTDFMFFDAWEVEHTDLNDGIGLGSQQWFIEQYQAEIATLDIEKDAKRITQLQQMIAVQQAELEALS